MKKSKPQRLKSDQFLKKVLSIPKVAKEFFETHLPENIKKAIDISSLEMTKHSFIDGQLKETLSDCLFKSSSSNGYVYILLEHQSTIDPNIAIRMRQYMMSICQMHIKEQDPKKEKILPLICPMLIYNGSKKYTAKRSFYDHFTDPDLARQLFEGEYKLIDLQSMDDKEILKSDNLGYIECLMKHIRDRDFMKFLSSIEMTIGKVDEDIFRISISYMIPRIKEENIVELKGLIENARGHEVMRSVADVWFEDGIKQGHAQGHAQGDAQGYARGIEQGKLLIAKNLLKQKLDINLISKATDLTEEEIKKLLLDDKRS